MSEQQHNSPQQFANKVVWITGASSGIGEALAKNFSACGARVVLSARNAVELERVRQECIAAGANDTDVLVVTIGVAAMFA